MGKKVITPEVAGKVLQLKAEGRSRKEIAKFLGIGRSTATRYCRGTEYVAVLKSKDAARNYGHKKVPCPDCGKTLIRTEANRCFACSTKRRKANKVPARPATPKLVAKAITIKHVVATPRLTSGEECPTSPTNRHHFLLDFRGIGECKYCKKPHTTPQHDSWRYYGAP